MEKREIEEIIINSIIEVISNIIVEKIRNYNLVNKFKLLVVFSGGTLGFEDSLSSLKKLKNDGFQMKVVLSKNAELVLGSKNIKEKLGIDDVYTETENNIMRFIEDSDLLILPSLTMNSAAKIANCINDNYLTMAVSKFILSKKPIISATNSCCPKDNKRLSELDGSINEFYEKKMIENMETLEKFGVIFTYGKNIERTADKLLNNKLEIKNQIDYRDRDIVTQSDVSIMEYKSVLTVKKSCVFTALAKEVLKSKKIVVQIMN